MGQECIISTISCSIECELSLQASTITTLVNPILPLYHMHCYLFIACDKEELSFLMAFVTSFLSE